MEFGLRSKTALVLGGGGGLGSAIAIALASEGANIAVADIDPKAIAETQAALAGFGGKSMGVVWDLADLSSIDAHVTSIESQLGPVDVLVNITGGPPPTSAAGQDPALWSKHFQSMVLSVIAITDRVLPKMRERKWGRVITSTSSGVVAPIPNLAHLECTAAFARRMVENSRPRNRQGRHYRQHQFCPAASLPAASGFSMKQKQSAKAAP